MLENFTINLPNRTLILVEFTNLRDQIGVWANINFDVHLPELGIAEEIGELTHAVLKREQKIRGEAARKTKTEIEDALGDAAIYMLHLAYIQKITPNFANELVPLDKELPLLGALHRSAGVLILRLHHFDSPFPLVVEWAILFSNLWNFAALHNLNLLNLTKDVWAKVSKRNWRKYPHNGLTT